MGKSTKSAAQPSRPRTPRPAHRFDDPDTRVYVGDCREVLPRIPEAAAGDVDLIFADPPFNWNRKYDKWRDNLPREDYIKFTREWLDACIAALAPHGALWVNIPDDSAAEIVMHLKGRSLHMVNWCVWHYRFGQNRLDAFINSKVHALYFVKDPSNRVWRLDEIMEPSDRATTYFDPRTHNKKAGPNGLRVPMDVWYGQYWGRIQGNNKERRASHDNQIPEVYLERVIRACSEPGMLVLDPFLGSGTTCVVARELERRSIGIEFSRACAKSAAARIHAGPIRVRKDQPTMHMTAIFQPRRADPSSADAATRNGSAASAASERSRGVRPPGKKASHPGKRRQRS